MGSGPFKTTPVSIQKINLRDIVLGPIFAEYEG